MTSFSVSRLFTSAAIVAALAACVNFSFFLTNSEGDNPVQTDGWGIFFVALVPAVLASLAFVTERFPIPKFTTGLIALLLLAFGFFPTSIGSYYIPSALLMCAAAATARRRNV